MTFVKVRLLIESMSFGDRATVRLNAGEPLENVPRSIEDHGHRVIEIVSEVPGESVGIHLLTLVKERPR